MNDEPVEDLFTILLIQIGEKSYRVSRVGLPPGVKGVAWSLETARDTHFVRHTPGQGASCDCPDWVFRREHRHPEGCRHVRGLRAVGLLPALPKANLAK